MADNKKPSFVVNGQIYEFPESLTMGEMCDAELHFGVEFGNNRTSGIRMIAAMLWIAVSRVDPTVTVEDIRALPPEVFESFSNLEDDAGPPDLEQSERLNETEQQNKNGHSGSGLNGIGEDPVEIPGATGPESLGTTATLESTTSAT
jgi:hypothetical protein